MMASTPLYDRGALTLREDGILLRNYYFPTLGAKFVPYSDVTGVEKIVCRIRNSKTWGMSFNRAWWCVGVRTVVSCFYMLRNQLDVYSSMMCNLAVCFYLL